MIIAVGSENPVKLAAVRTTIARIWPAAEVRGIAVPSGVSAMPMNDAECIAGARGRARAAVAALDANMGLGLEGGVQPADGQLFLTGWVVAVDRSGREGVGSAARLPLPPAVGAAVLAGRELGPLMDELTGRELTNHAEGAIGILTHQLMTRQLSFEAGVAYALVPWLNPELYP
ncbi:MAG: inosine/xanthosine triphosphatase [Anaerolineales bacterium]|nr:inosine/xanthosine triphosphatase [Anaerolineales bacterium]